jgi:hypothetical protein
MVLLNYNTSEKYISRYESNTPLVRTGTVNSTPLKSFCNALLYCCSKKFIANDDEGRLKLIDDLEADFKLLYRDGQMFETFYVDVFKTMESLLGEFYDFILNSNKDVKEKSLLMTLLTNIFHDDDDTPADEKTSPKTIITNYRHIQTIFKTSDVKKISRVLLHKKYISVVDLKNSLLKDVKHFLKFQDSINDGSEHSTKLKIHIMDLMSKLFDVTVASLQVPDFSPHEVSDTFFQLAQMKFDCNLFILNTINSDVIYCNAYDKKKKSIILLSHDNLNFDIIGKLRDDIITRQFFPYEEIIKSILYYHENQL